MSINLGSMLGIQPANTQPAGTQAASSQLPAFADYSAGDTFQAEVTGVKGDMVTMTTPQGSEFETQFPQGVQVNPGDLVDMALVSKNANGVSLKPIAVNGQPIQLESNALQSYLMDNGIAPSRLNEGAAQVLMNYSIAPTPKNVGQLVQVAMALPEIPTSVAVTMAQNEIPPTQANAQALMQLTVQPPVLGQDISSLSGMVEKGAEGQIFSQVFPQVAAETATPEQMQILDRGGLQQFAGQLGNQIQQQGMENMTPRQVQTAIHQFVQQLPASPEQRQAIEQVLQQAFSQTSEAVQNQGPQSAPTTVSAQPSAEQLQTAQQPAALPEGQPAVQNTGGEVAQTAVPLTDEQPVAAAAPQTAQTVPQESASQLGQQPVGGETQAQPAAQTATPENAQNASQQPVQNEQPQQTQNQTAAAPAAPQVPADEAQPRVQESAQGIQEEQPADKEARPAQTENRPSEREAPARTAETLVQENPVRHEANKIMSTLGKMVVKVRDGAVQEDAKALQDGVRDQQHLSNLTKESVSRLFGSSSAITQKANEMSNQVRVGGQLDQFYYAQVPFQTQQMEGTADLYVFQRQGQKAERERTHITVLIGLDTPHMGRVESVLRSQDNRLSVEFRVSSKRVQTFFEEAVSGFREEMSSIGFPLEAVRVSQIGEKVTPLNAMQVMEPKQEIRLRGLDIEA